MGFGFCSKCCGGGVNLTLKGCGAPTFLPSGYVVTFKNHTGGATLGTLNVGAAGNVSGTIPLSGVTQVDIVCARFATVTVNVVGGGISGGFTLAPATGYHCPGGTNTCAIPAPDNLFLTTPVGTVTLTWGGGGEWSAHQNSAVLNPVCQNDGSCAASTVDVLWELFGASNLPNQWTLRLNWYSGVAGFNCGNNTICPHWSTPYFGAGGCAIVRVTVNCGGCVTPYTGSGTLPATTPQLTNCCGGLAPPAPANWNLPIPGAFSWSE